MFSTMSHCHVVIDSISLYERPAWLTAHIFTVLTRTTKNDYNIINVVCKTYVNSVDVTHATCLMCVASVSFYSNMHSIGQS